MSMSENQRASQVCNTCKARKKRCDKYLPDCGYCTKRGLDCRYTKLPLFRSTDAAAGRDSTTWQWRMTGIATDRDVASGFKSDVSPLMASLYDFLRTDERVALSELLYYQVSRVIQLANLSLRDVTDRFFEGFHRWLPVISPQNFCKTIIDLHEGAPNPDFSILLLAMCLIILRPLPSTLPKSTICLKSLYVTVRLSFAQVQAVICASTTLVQAGILIAAYDYACGRPELAYISIGTCARMSGVAGFDRGEARSKEVQLDAESTLRVLEERNVWWGIIFIER